MVNANQIDMKMKMKMEMKMYVCIYELATIGVKCCVPCLLAEYCGPTLLRHEEVVSVLLALTCVAKDRRLFRAQRLHALLFRLAVAVARYAARRAWSIFKDSMKVVERVRTDEPGVLHLCLLLPLVLLRLVALPPAVAVRQ
mmetsp:Transcript_19795/g.51829  ORF Transcript_19795/g.51829 Transcript_19795/m.51829 type:complete len:141 (+) Transcript_19795:145-567(+)